MPHQMLYSWIMLDTVLAHKLSGISLFHSIRALRVSSVDILINVLIYIMVDTSRNVHQSFSGKSLTT